MQSNTRLTEKAQQSQNKMEKMTIHMREIAIKTEQETVFMRIVTVVTLFFLPGTFISVSDFHLPSLSMQRLNMVDLDVDRHFEIPFRFWEA